jgi:hypothetical protein
VRSSVWRRGRWRSRSPEDATQEAAGHGGYDQQVFMAHEDTANLKRFRRPVTRLVARIHKYDNKVDFLCTRALPRKMRLPSDLEHSTGTASPQRCRQQLTGGWKTATSFRSAFRCCCSRLGGFCTLLDLETLRRPAGMRYVGAIPAGSAQTLRIVVRKVSLQSLRAIGGAYFRRTAIRFAAGTANAAGDFLGKTRQTPC